MSKGKHSDAPKEKTWVRASHDQTRLPQWLSQPLTPHEPIYNPAAKVGALRWMLIWASARYPKICFLLWLVPALVAWGVLLAFSVHLASGTLIFLALLELPLLLALLYLLWPMLLYRLAGLPRPAARPSRSKTQLSAQAYYRGSCLIWLCALGSAAVPATWGIVLALHLSDDAGFGAVPLFLFLVSLGLLLALAILKGIWQVVGLFRHNPMRSMPYRRSDLVPDHGDGSAHKSRRRKAPETMPEAQATITEPTNG
ncbi:MAG TPA: hypothetical protein VFU69_14900 [Ktedonobacterales bacterium]|nr:hypothetical protein [Ktedonobacterales bacterium]